MENWQFLIQKQGDRGWNTLESPNLTILPGKYRVLARSLLMNTDVEVRVTHISTEEAPPKRRLLKRSRRTNAEGLMAVIPFTQFKPGIWELRCSGDVMSEMLGKSWQHILRIEVLSEQQHQLPSHNDGQGETENEVNMLMNPLVNPMWLRGETTEQILQNLLDLALPTEEPSIEEESFDDALTLPPALLVNLNLEQDTYVAKWGSNFIIHGNVEINDLENLEDDKLKVKKLSNLQLTISLQTPVNSKNINQIQQSLSDQILPFSFSTSIDIPGECESKLLLGDINLYGIYGEIGEIKLLGSHSFIITADVSELLAVKNQNSHVPNSLVENNQPKQAKPVSSIGLELFNVAKTPKLAQFHVLRSSVNQTLPPQIKPVVTAENLSPKLPSLPKTSLSDAEAREKATSAIPPINLEKLLIKSVKTSFPYLKRSKIQTNKEKEEIKNQSLLPVAISEKEDVPELLVNNDVKDEHLQEAITNIYQAEIVDDLSISEKESVPELLVDSDVKDEHLQEAITNIYEEEIVDNISEYINIIKSERLPESNIIEDSEVLENNIAEPSEIAEINDQENQFSFSLLQQWREIQEESISEEIYEKEISEDQEIENQLDDITENTQIEINQPVEASIPIREIVPNWLSQEIVMDDIVIETVAEEKKDNLLVDKESDIVDFVMRKSLPTPQLYLTEGELIAGTSIMVRVELPEILSDVTVKLWIEDYQTRSLLDGPHIITDLHSTAWGTMETVASLVVPFGCLEMRLGAIAFHQVTHQESNKVTILKKIIPADLPKMDLDELLGL